MKSDRDLVSVIIPTFNRADMICDTIDNVFNQTYSNFELIVVDDGSTDATQSKLRQYGTRIRVITQSNCGPAVARNRGVEAARGEIIAFQDSDDLWKPRKLELQVALLQKYGRSVPCCLCAVLLRIVDGREYTSFDHSSIRMRHEEGIWENVPDVLATRFVLFNQAAAIRREAFERVGGFDTDLKYLEDYSLALRLASQGRWAFIREPLVLYGEGSPGSLAQAGLREPVVLTQCDVTICERLLLEMKGSRQKASFHNHLKRRLKGARRRLFASRLMEKKSRAAHFVGKLIMRTDHYGRSAFIRSPWFPQPITYPSNCNNSCRLSFHEDSLSGREAAQRNI